MVQDKFCYDCTYDTREYVVDLCPVHSLTFDLVKALKDMVATHGMHGPCKHNTCVECDRAYHTARVLIGKVEGKP